MNNTDFLQFLNANGIDSITNLPSEYDYSIADDSLVLKPNMKGVLGNIQNGTSAFESCVILLKRYCGKLFNSVIIDWEETDEQHKYLNLSNRFVYRLTRFVQSYDWVQLARKIPTMPALLYCNAPIMNSMPNKEPPKESGIWTRHNFVKQNANNYDVIEALLPTALYDGIISSETCYLPLSLCHLETWAIKGDEMFVFVLEKPKSNPLGLISELMYYTNLLCDLLSHNIIVDRKRASMAVQNKYCRFDKFYEFYNGQKKISKIHSVLLVDELHPLIDDEVLKIINSSIRFKQHNVSFEVCKH